MKTIAVQAHVRVYSGMWIYDCPRAHCGNAEMVDPGAELFACTNCEQVGELVWPPNPTEIMAVLQKRPVPGTRNWFPEGHALAIAANAPHGQTVAELDAEGREHGVT